MLTVNYNQGKNISPVAFVFACPGQREKLAQKVVAGSTGKNLDKLLSVLQSSENEKIQKLFPSASRYDYLITNSSDIVHYKALDGQTLPNKKEYSKEKNIKRLCYELSSSEYVIAFGKEAKAVSELVKAEYIKENKNQIPNFILSIPHLSFLSLNQISEDVNGKKIEKGDPLATQKRIEKVARKIECSII